jgi:multidrug resistance efflux pump
MKTRRIALILTILILALLSGGYVWWQKTGLAAPQPQPLKGSGTIETTPVAVGSLVGGRIQQVFVEAGHLVQPGEVLLTLDAYRLPAEEREISAQLAQAQAVLHSLEAGPRPQEIAQARSRYRQAQAQARLVELGPRTEAIETATASRKQAETDRDQAKVTFTRFEALLDQHVISRQEFDQVQSTYVMSEERLNSAIQQELTLTRGSRPQEIVAAKEEMNAARQQMALLQAGTRPEDIAAQQAVVNALYARLNQLATTRQELQVVSPCACQVSVLDVKPGQLVMPSQTVAELTNLADLWVRVYVPEEQFGRVHPGDTVEIRVDAYPNRSIRGHVVQLADRAEFTPRNVQTQETRRMQVFGIKVALDNRSRLLRPGMPADVTFTSTRH